MNYGFTINPSATLLASRMMTRVEYKEVRRWFRIVARITAKKLNYDKTQQAAMDLILYGSCEINTEAYI